jgi:hypothetical protein
VTFAVGLWATIVNWGTPTGQCDNITLAIDPLPHLNNRWDGWWGGHP